MKGTRNKFREDAVLIYIGGIYTSPENYEELVKVTDINFIR
jgi:hypothetical protein